jgi:acetoin utilization protein AcuB
MLVRDWMSKDVVSVDVNTNMQQAITLMMEHNISRLPVMENGNLVGMVTDRDLRRAAPSDTTVMEVRHILYHLTTVQMGAIMTRNLITVAPEFTLEEFAEVLLNNKISGCPVVDRDGNLVGIITKQDLFRAIVSVSGLPNRGIQFGFLLEDRPGSTKEITDVIRKYGARLMSVVSSYAEAPHGYRNTYIRVFDMDRTRLDDLIGELRRIAKMIYMVDHRENKREVY